MIKIPYVLGYSLFEKADIVVAEELLTEYNDFMGFNKIRIQKMAKVSNAFDGQENPENPENTEAKQQADKQKAEQQIEHNKQVAISHFEKLFGNNDIPESTLVGLKIDYDTIQKVLLDESENKISILESEFNHIAPIIRATASMLLFAEHIVTGLQKLADNKNEKEKEKCELAIEFAKEGFELLLDGVAKGNLVIPEYHKSRKETNKIKTVSGYIALCEKLFFINRDY